MKWFKGNSMKYTNKLLINVCNPKQWKTISFKELTTEGYPVYGANGIIGCFTTYTHEKSTLAITCRGATCGALNITKPFSYINGNAMALDNLADNISIKYLYYFLKRRGFADVISGSAQPQITRQGLSSIELPCPCLEIQQKIVDVLDKAQALIDKRKEQLEKLDELVQSVFYEMFGDPVRNNNQYTWVIIRELALEVKYGTSKKADASKGHYPILRMNNISYNGYWDFTELKYIDLEDNEFDKYLVCKGDLLFNRTNSKELVGKCAVYKNEEHMAYAGYLIRVRINQKATPEYVWGYLNSRHGKAVLKKMCKNIIGMANINAQELQDIPILLPPIDLQNQFAHFVEKTEQQKALMQQSLVEMENNFHSIMQRAFKGELF